MKSSISTILISLAVASQVNCMPSSLSFMTGPSGSSISKQSQLLLNIRGGELEQESASLTEDGMATGFDTEGNPIIAEDSIVEETPAAPMSNNIIMSMLLPIKSAFENAGFFYMNSLSSYPMQTIALTATVAVLLIWSLVSVLGGSSKNEEVVKKVEVKKVAPAPVATPPKQIDSTSVGSRGIITGLGTAAATTFAIYQAVNRPTSAEEETSEEGRRESSVEEENVHGNTVFKAQEVLLGGQRLLKNVCNQIGITKSPRKEDELYSNESEMYES
jgi:hypothetical protein